MISANDSILRDLDPEEIEKLMSEKKPAARKKLIKSFLIKTYRSNLKNITNNHEYAMIKNNYNYLIFSSFASLLFSLINYKILFTGVWEIRRFYFNPTKIPFLFKFLFSAWTGYFLLENMCMNFAYSNDDIYAMAVRDFEETKRNKLNDKI